MFFCILPFFPLIIFFSTCLLASPVCLPSIVIALTFVFLVFLLVFHSLPLFPVSIRVSLYDLTDSNAGESSHQSTPEPTEFGCNAKKYGSGCCLTIFNALCPEWSFLIRIQDGLATPFGSLHLLGKKSAFLDLHSSWLLWSLADYSYYLHGRNQVACKHLAFTLQAVMNGALFTATTNTFQKAQLFLWCTSCFRFVSHISQCWQVAYECLQSSLHFSCIFY